MATNQGGQTGKSSRAMGTASPNGNNKKGDATNKTTWNDKERS